MIEINVEFPEREIIQANAEVNKEKTFTSNITINAKPEITGVTASVDDNTGTPYVVVTPTGTGTEYSFDLAFHNLKGETADVEAIIQNVLNNIQTTGNLETVVEGLNLTIKNTTYSFEQSVSSDTWTINHNLGKYPSVTIIDSAGNLLIPAVSYSDENTCVCEMLGATTGTAYLN